MEELAQSFDRALGLPGVGDTLVRGLRVVEHSFAKGEILQFQAEEADAVLWLRQGWVASTLDLYDGSRSILALYAPGDVIGLEYLGRATTLCDLVAMDSGHVLSVPIVDLKAQLEAHPAIDKAVTALISRRYGALQARLGVFGSGDAVAKLTHLIHALRSKAVRNGVPTPDTLQTPLSQRDIADALGLTNVTVSRAFSKLQDVVTYKSGVIEILDHQALLAQAGGNVESMPITDMFD